MPPTNSGTPKRPRKSWRIQKERLKFSGILQAGADAGVLSVIRPRENHSRTHRLLIAVDDFLGGTARLKLD